MKPHPAAEKTLLLKGRAFRLRDLVAGDRDRYQIFFNALSEESIRCRFGHLIAKLTLAGAAERTQLDAQAEKAIVAVDKSTGDFVAIGRCCLDRSRGEAEISLVVAENMRNLGLGRAILGELVARAHHEGSHCINAYIATKNAPILSLLRERGFTIVADALSEETKLSLKVRCPGGT